MGKETRERILQVAARLFQERGYAATGVATILRDAGVNSGSLYHFFPGKGELLAGVLERYREGLGATIFEAVEEETDDDVDRVFVLLDGYRRRLAASDCRRGCPVGDLALEVAGDDRRARGLADGYFADWVGHVRHWLESAGDRLPADIDPEGLARMVLAVMEGAVMQARASGSLEAFDAAVAELRRHFELLQGRGRTATETLDARPRTPSDEPPAEPGPGIHKEWRSW